MTNFEKYADKIKDIDYDLAVVDNRIAKCDVISCSSCDFNKGKPDCDEEKIKWLYEEYKEPQVDWSKVAVDTPILVTDFERKENLVHAHFAKYEDGKVYAWVSGCTSWSVDHDLEIESWKYAQLAEVK